MSRRRSYHALTVVSALVLLTVNIFALGFSSRAHADTQPSITGNWSANCTTFTITSTSDFPADTNFSAYMPSGDETTTIHEGPANFGDPLVFTGLDGSNGITIQIDGSLRPTAYACTQVRGGYVEGTPQTCDTVAVTGGIPGRTEAYFYPRVLRLFNEDGSYMGKEIAAQELPEGENGATYALPIKGTFDELTPGSTYIVKYGLLYN